MIWSIEWRLIRKYKEKFFLEALLAVAGLLISILTQERSPYYWAIFVITILASFVLMRKTYVEISNDEKQSKLEQAELQKIHQQLNNLQQERTQLRARNILIRKLINEGLISSEDVIKNIKKQAVYMLYIATNSFPVVQDKRRNNPYIIKADREYTKWLQDTMGFIKVGHSSSKFYLRTERNLPRKLKNTSIFSRYLKSELDRIFKEEWDEFLQRLSRKKRPLMKQTYKTYESKSYHEVLKCDFILSKSVTTDARIVNVLQQKLNDDLFKLLTEELQVDRLEMDANKQHEVSKFLRDISIAIILYEVPIKKRKTIVSLDDKLRESLEIETFTQFHNAATEDIESVLKQKMNTEESKKYALMIKKRAGEFKTAISEMGLNI